MVVDVTTSRPRGAGTRHIGAVRRIAGSHRIERTRRGSPPRGAAPAWARALLRRAVALKVGFALIAALGITSVLVVTQPVAD